MFLSSAEEEEQNGSDLLGGEEFAVEKAEREGGDNEKTGNKNHQEVSYEPAFGGFNHELAPCPLDGIPLYIL